jgi:hypothetical protein
MATAPEQTGVESSTTASAGRHFRTEADGGTASTWGWPIALFVAVFAADLASPSGMTADSIRQASVAVSMVHFHTIGLDPLLRYQVNPGAAVTKVGHHVYPYFPWGGSLFAVPSVVVYDIAHHLGIGPGAVGLVREHRDWDIQVASMSAVVAATAVIVYRIALRVLRLSPGGRHRRWAAGVAVAFAFTTPAWSTASRSMWEHGPSMLCLSIAVLCALRADAGERGWTGLGVALGAAYAMRPTDALPIAILGVWVLVWHRRQAAWVILGGLPPVLILVIVDLVAYHQLLTPYYTQGQSFDFSSNVLTAAAGNLVSPSRGLFIFVPLVLLSIAGVVLLWRGRRLTPLWGALAVYPVLQWFLISPFKHWWAGDSYGPRLWTDLMPVFVVLALPAVEHLAEHRFNRQRAVAGVVVVALVWSFAVHAQGATLRSAWCWNNEPTDVDAHPSKVWNWSDPQFLRGIRALVWGPNRHSELLRDGVDRYGCPVEPIRP